MAEPKENLLMEKIVSLCKRRGFIYQSSEIYGGINGFWDYGPLGAELKRNLRDTWWRAMTRDREDVVGLDATIIMHPAIWKASGHVDTFSDPMSDCLVTKKRFRSDLYYRLAVIEVREEEVAARILDVAHHARCRVHHAFLAHEGDAATLVHRDAIRRGETDLEGIFHGGIVLQPGRPARRFVARHCAAFQAPYKPSLCSKMLHAAEQLVTPTTRSGGLTVQHFGSPRRSWMSRYVCIANVRRS